MPKKLAGINFVNESSRETLNDFLSEHGFHVLVLDGEDVTDKASFFEAAADSLPQEEGLIARGSWDAFIDSHRGGLVDLGEKRVAVVWTHAERMVNGSLADLWDALGCFDFVARELASAELGLPYPVYLQIFLVGNGQNFPTFSPDTVLSCRQKSKVKQ